MPLLPRGLGAERSIRGVHLPIPRLVRGRTASEPSTPGAPGNERVVGAGRRSPLHGLAGDAAELVYAEQPLHRDRPAADPIVILNEMDNDDKHHLLHPAFVHTRARTGLDLIET